ncbi:hypothetical protein MTR_7g101160 [Medicago truncatula]|uniref:Uncharacterized protein n=1 Tax=Medicago truncatula TaxID=3880 RepID=G7L2S8_MEDTR|nr:hypothetical protein MTR_7g101160 [Medicago truncatula]
MLSVPGSLYAICRVHHDSDELSEWRTRSHACCEIEKAEVVQDSYIRLSNNRDLFEMLFGTKSSHDISIYSHLLNIWNTPNKVSELHRMEATKRETNWS